MLELTAVQGILVGLFVGLVALFISMHARYMNSVVKGKKVNYYWNLGAFLVLMVMIVWGYFHYKTDAPFYIFSLAFLFSVILSWGSAKNRYDENNQNKIAHA